MGAALTTVQVFFPQVSTVRDATKDLRITVTAEDCEKGERKNKSACAIAKWSIREKKVDEVLVSRARIYLIWGDLAIRYTLGGRAKEEVKRFDTTGEFRPGTYVLKAPDKKEQLGNSHSQNIHKKGVYPRIKERHIGVHSDDGIRIMKSPVKSRILQAAEQLASTII